MNHAAEELVTALERDPLAAVIPFRRRGKLAEFHVTMSVLVRARSTREAALKGAQEIASEDGLFVTVEPDESHAVTSTFVVARPRPSVMQLQIAHSEKK